MNDHKGWLARADEDYRSIQALRAIPDPPWNSISFHAQQLAEKALKALLIFHGENPPKTHNLPALVALLIAKGVPLPDLTKECDALYAPYITSRYSPTALTAADVEPLIESAFRIREIVLRLVKP